MHVVFLFLLEKQKYDESWQHKMNETNRFSRVLEKKTKWICANVCEESFRRNLLLSALKMLF